MIKVLYVFHWRGEGEGNGISFGCTNMKVLSERTGIGYSNLVRVFTRLKRDYWEDRKQGYFIIRIMGKDIYKGRQKISRRGFVRFTERKK